MQVVDRVVGLAKFEEVLITIEPVVLQDFLLYPPISPRRQDRRVVSDDTTHKASPLSTACVEIRGTPDQVEKQILAEVVEFLCWETHRFHQEGGLKRSLPDKIRIARWSH